MNRHIIGFLLITSILTSCDMKKTYNYAEIVEENYQGKKETKEKNFETFKATSDSAAYLEAYQNFCISLRAYKNVNENVQQRLGTGSGFFTEIPIKFKLYNDKNEDITYSVFFADKDKREKEITEMILSLGNTIQKSIEEKK